jgi:tRNA dimethylallyltransferase
MTDANKAILIAGPTASGKSELALAIAERVGGMIINADSMQVYRELRILSARPTHEEETRVPHALYGFVPAREAYSAGRFASDAAAAIGKARSEGLRPIIVGGTGLYFKALLEGLSPVPRIEHAVRDHWRGEAERHGAPELHRRLAKRDPVMAARLAENDTQRVVRALEVIEQTGRSLAEWQKLRDAPVLDEAETVRLLVTLDRAALQTRVGARFDRMMDDGALEEAKAIAELDLDPTLPAMRAIGLRPLLAALAGESGVDDATAAAKLETRQYIKRQGTWFRRYMISWKNIETQYMESNLSHIIAFIRR